MLLYKAFRGLLGQPVFLGWKGAPHLCFTLYVQMKEKKWGKDPLTPCHSWTFVSTSFLLNAKHGFFTCCLCFVCLERALAHTPGN